MKKKTLSPKSLFIAVFVLSVVVFLLMLFPDIGSVLGPNILIIWVLLGLSGIGLVIITYKERVKGKLKFFLLSSGFSAAGFLLGGDEIIGFLAYAIWRGRSHLLSSIRSNSI